MAVHSAMYCINDDVDGDIMNGMVWNGFGICEKGYSRKSHRRLFIKISIHHNDSMRVCVGTHLKDAWDETSETEAKSVFDTNM